MDQAVRVNITSYNRYGHLKLCLSWLLSWRDPGLTVCVWDDGSSDGRIQPLLQVLQSKGLIEVKLSAADSATRSKEGKEARLGALRRTIVQEFLTSRSEPYVMLMDDDVLTLGQTIAQAVRDFSFLSTMDYLRAGAYTLHAWLTSHAFMRIGNQMFAEVVLSGESCLIMSRAMLADVGNHFSAEPKGFADNQFYALRHKQYKYMTRVYPPYGVQHLGIGTGGSCVHQDSSHVPLWVQSPYRYNYPAHLTTKWLPVDSFDVDYYLDLLKYVPAALAPEKYMEEKHVEVPL